jgi:imidazolonepropionase-like amidohydrolase
LAEVLTAPRVITGDGPVTDGAVVVSDSTLGWVGQADALPAEFASLPRTGHQGATIMPGLIDSHVHLGFDGGPGPADRMRAETDEQQLILMLQRQGLLGIGVTTAGSRARSYLAIAVRDAVAAGRPRAR